MRQLTFALLASLVLAGTVHAELVNVGLNSPPVNPAQPTSDTPVSANVRILACSEIPITVERVGTVINLRYANDNCPIIPIPFDTKVPLGTLPAGVYQLRVLEVSDPAHPRVDDEAVFAVSPSPCEPPQGPPVVDGGAPRLCLQEGRFAVTAEWTSHDGDRGFGQPVPLTTEGGAFWFFDDDNLELMVKVVDACEYNGRFWVFAAGLTNVQVTVQVREVSTGAVRTYSRAAGPLFQPVGDTNAFVCALSGTRALG